MRAIPFKKKNVKLAIKPEVALKVRKNCLQRVSRYCEGHQDLGCFLVLSNQTTELGIEIDYHSFWNKELLFSCIFNTSHKIPCKVYQYTNPAIGLLNFCKQKLTAPPITPSLNYHYNTDHMSQTLSWDNHWTSKINTIKLNPHKSP